MALVLPLAALQFLPRNGSRDHIAGMCRDSAKGWRVIIDKLENPAGMGFPAFV
jgi:hypothetical protein